MSSAASAPSSNSAMTNLKRNSDDVEWDYGVLVDLTNLNVIKCKLCGLVVKAGIYRLKQHIAHIHGEVKPCWELTNEDQQKCAKVIDDSKKAKKARAEKQQQVRDAVDIDGAPVDEEESTNGESQGLDEVGNSVARKVGPLDRFTLPLDPASLSAKVVRQQKISEAIWKERMHKLKRYIAKWVYVHGIPFRSIINEEFDQMVEVAGLCGPGGRKPTQHELREKLLYDEVEDTKKLLKKRRSIMNLCLHCNISSTFLESHVSDERHTGHMIFEYVDATIEKVGAKNIVQVVTDNASNNMAVKDLLFVKRPNKFWSLCATHTLNLMLEGIGKMKKFKSIIDQAKAVTIFIYAHHRTLSLMRKYTKKRDIVRPGATRFASSFLTLQSLYEKKDQLRIMSQCQCDEWEKLCGLTHMKKNSKVVLSTATMVKPAFWGGVGLCLRLFESLIKALHMVDSDIKPSLAFLYGDILKAKEEIMATIGNVDKAVNLNLYLGIMEIIDEKMKGRLDTPLHLAAYFLNPYFSFNDPSIFTNEHVMDGLISAIETFYHGGYDKQSQVLNAEMDKFKDTEGHFAKAVAKVGYKDYNFNPGGDDEIDVELVAGLTLKLTKEACGTEEVAKLHRSSRLAQMRNVDEDIIEEPEEEPLHDDDEEIEFESDQEDVVLVDGVGEQKGEEDD
uniref:DUF659 domain-containing protein n=1 Tax=Setaria italica TaxID=4555 RepID=K3XSF2_SETIT